MQELDQKSTGEHESDGLAGWQYVVIDRATGEKIVKNRQKKTPPRPPSTPCFVVLWVLSVL